MVNYPFFCFNSNMVRLKEIPKLLIFHTREFQFQYGTIKSLSRLGFGSILSCFNSNMVRLKVVPMTLKKVVIFVSIPIWYD